MSPDSMRRAASTAQEWFDNASIQKAEIEEVANQSVAATPSPTPEKPIIVIGRQLGAALTKLFDADLMEAAGVLAEYYNPFDGVDVSDKDKATAESTLGLFNYAFKLKFVSPGIEDRDELIWRRSRTMIPKRRSSRPSARF